MPESASQASPGTDGEMAHLVMAVARKADWCKVLGVLAARPAFPSEIGERSHLNLAFVSKILARMRQLGLVVLASGAAELVDRRTRLYMLTPKGQAAHDGIAVLAKTSRR